MNADRSGESEKERLDRKLTQLLDEVRVTLPGVQALFGFLLIVPFNRGWGESTSAFQREVYVVALVSAAVASILLMATSAFHRHRFPRLVRETVEDKREVVGAQDRLAVAGLVALSLAVCASILLVFDVIFDGTVAGAIALAIGLTYAWFWYGLPISRRWRDPRSSIGKQTPSSDDAR